MSAPGNEFDEEPAVFSFEEAVELDAREQKAMADVDAGRFITHEGGPLAEVLGDGKRAAATRMRRLIWSTDAIDDLRATRTVRGPRTYDGATLHHSLRCLARRDSDRVRPSQRAAA